MDHLPICHLLGLLAFRIKSLFLASTPPLLSCRKQSDLGLVIHTAPLAPASPRTRLCPALLLSEEHWPDCMRVHPCDLIFSLLPLGFISRGITCVDGRRRMSRRESGDTTQPTAAGSGSTLGCSGVGDTYPGSALSPSRC